MDNPIRWCSRPSQKVVMLPMGKWMAKFGESKGIGFFEKENVMPPKKTIQSNHDVFKKAYWSKKVLHVWRPRVCNCEMNARDWSFFIAIWNEIYKNDDDNNPIMIGFFSISKSMIESLGCHFQFNPTRWNSTNLRYQVAERVALHKTPPKQGMMDDKNITGWINGCFWFP